ncbi:MAG: transcriptional regulator, TetR family [Rhodoferax sp.]|nr:transcriptional regulator, TetR family [Rhodoferax sp.]
MSSAVLAGHAPASLPPPVPQAPTLKGEARRMRLLDAAADAFMQHGFAATSMQLIVQQAGGSATTAYQLFGNKEGLLLAVLQRELDQLGAEVFPDVPAERPVRAALEHIVARLLGFCVRQRSVRFYRLVMAESQRLPEVAGYMRSQIDMLIHAPLIRCLDNACARGELRIDDTRQATLMLGHLINGIAHEARILGGYTDGPSPADRAACRFGVDAFLRAFAA